MRYASFQQKFKIHGAQETLTGVLHCAQDRENRPAMINLEIYREGTLASAMAHSFCAAINTAIENGVPLQNFIQEFKGWRFDPSGIVEGSPNVERCTSLLDYVAQELEATFYKETES